MASKDFHHPFEPYDIQQQFMEAVYECIEDKNLGIFESPTGTGKSLSLICGSLTWLREHKRKAFDESIAAIKLDDDEPQWVLEHGRDARRHEIRQMRKDFESRLQKIRDREQKAREQQRNGVIRPAKRQKRADDDGHAADDEEQYILDDYESDDEKACNSNKQTVYSAETLQLMERVGILADRDKSNGDSETIEELKILFCSRTHSQLSQFVGELQRVSLPPGLPPETKSEAEDTTGTGVEAVKQLTLGSRKNLCINPQVAALTTQTAINERCIELQQSNVSAHQKCRFMPAKDRQDLVLDFRDHALSKVQDIEDLSRIGSKLQICPYYASRAAIAPAEMITLPYPLLLQKSAREALGLSVKGHVVIIDEAHNLISAIEGIYSTSITERQLRLARESLLNYLQRFRNRLKGKNRSYVAQIVRVIDSLLGCIDHLKTETAPAGTLSSHSMLAGKAVDQINLTKLVRYVNDSKLARKVEGYIAMCKRKENASAHSPDPVDVPTLMHLQNFFATLMNPSEEGRFFWSKQGESIALRYLLLDPSEHFREIVQDARAVILAGGTMSPMEDYRTQLVPYLNSIKTFSCGHLIPTESLHVRTIASDGNGSLEFSFQNRSNPTAAMRTGNILVRLAPLVKGGLVVFFPSYSYLEQVKNVWDQNSITQQLAAIKPIFSDRRHGSGENTFEAYSEVINRGDQGAILLSVIGGKLSEGINFSDNLGRCVVVVGLPFPNLETPEWKAKMQYLEDKATARGEVRGRASRQHAENVCMRSVNQAVGRVIRHKADWASILLMDSRYTQHRIQGKLPGWIKTCLPNNATTDANEVADEVEAFFNARCP